MLTIINLMLATFFCACYNKRIYCVIVNKNNYIKYQLTHSGEVVITLTTIHFTLVFRSRCHCLLRRPKVITGGETISNSMALLYGGVMSPESKSLDRENTLGRLCISRSLTRNLSQPWTVSYMGRCDVGSRWVLFGLEIRSITENFKK